MKTPLTDERIVTFDGVDYVHIANVRDDFTGKKARDADIVSSDFAWVDIDPPKWMNSQLVELEAWREKTLMSLEKLDAHWIYDSGRGYWLFWQLSEAVSADECRELNQIAAAHVRANTGLKPDACHDPSRVCKPVGEPNPKTGQLTEFLQENFLEVTINPSEFRNRAIAPVTTAFDLDFDRKLGVELTSIPSDLLPILEGQPEDRSATLFRVAASLKQSGYSFDTSVSQIEDYVRAWVGPNGIADGKFDGPQMERHFSRCWAKVSAPADDFDTLSPEEQAALIRREKDEDRAIGNAKNEEQLVKQITLAQALNDLVYVSSVGGVVHVPTGKAWKSVELAAAHFSASRMPAKKQDGPGRPAKPTAVVSAWMASPARKTVDHVTWCPDAPLFCDAPEQRGTAVNTWIASDDWLESPEDWEELSKPFFDHVAYLLPVAEEREDFLDWVAHIFQKPGELPHTAWLMITPSRGIGRNWMSSVLTRCLAGHVAAGLDISDVLSSGFNGRMSQKLLAVVDEVREGSDHGKYRKLSRLQKVITESEREINRKFGLQSVEHNKMRWLMFSNFSDALPYDEKDRRIRVSFNPTVQRSSDYYKRLYSLRRSDRFIRSVTAALRFRDISGFNPGAHAPMTAAKRETLEFMRSDEARAVADFLEKWPEKLCGRRDIEDMFDLDEHFRLSTPSNQLLKHMVSELGGTVTSTRYYLRNGAKDPVVIVDGAMTPSEVQRLGAREARAIIERGRDTLQA